MMTTINKMGGQLIQGLVDFLATPLKVWRMGQFSLLTAMAALLAVSGAGRGICDSGSSNTFSGPDTPFHFAANGNFGARGQYLPGKAGFNLADVNSLAELNSLPAGVKGLVWVGQCSGVDGRFIQTVTPFIGNPKLFGYYLMDDPDPRLLAGFAKRSGYCPPSNLKAQSDWIHEHAPGAKTFILPMNMASREHPTYENTYNPENSGVDFYGIDPYPCFTGPGDCDYQMIQRYVKAAEEAGIPRARMIPVYQTFGGGEWKDEAGGKYVLPTTKQLREMLARWAELVPAPKFDYAYSWGSQKSDSALESSTELKEAFAIHNGTASVGAH
jgi:hypothetical protein